MLVHCLPNLFQVPFGQSRIEFRRTSHPVTWFRRHTLEFHWRQVEHVVEAFFESLERPKPESVATTFIGSSVFCKRFAANTSASF